MNKFKVGDKIRHPFAGEGVIMKFAGKKSVRCKWADGVSGIAHLSSLERIEGYKK